MNGGEEASTYYSKTLLKASLLQMLEPREKKITTKMLKELDIQIISGMIISVQK